MSAAREYAYTVGDYLLDRLAELGVTEVFGVPGDYNLEFLDHVVAHPQLRWVGNANELNAGYAADGYGRLRGMSAVVTTFGVGELSAANAIAGSYAEHVPVVHIVGGPSKDAQGTRRALHHSLGDGDFEHFLRVSREITCAQANLMPATAAREIDRVLSEVREQRRPGYLLLPTDVARFETEPPTAPLPRYTGGTSPRALALFKEAATTLIADHQLTVLADLLVHRLNAVGNLEALLAADPTGHSSWTANVECPTQVTESGAPRSFRYAPSLATTGMSSGARLSYWLLPPPSFHRSRSVNRLFNGAQGLKKWPDSPWGA